MTDNSDIHRADFSVHSLTLWDDLIGNERAKRILPTIIHRPGIPPKVFLAGPAGSGKSTLIEHLCATLMCYNPKGNDPCGQCTGCHTFKPGHRNSGMFASADWGQPTPVHYVALNCRNTTFAILEAELNGIRIVDGQRIVHLEEAAGLKKLQRDESIMEIMDDPDFATCRWFASAVQDHGLDPQIRRRWTVNIATSPPDAHAAACLLAKRCHESRIEVNHPATLELLVQRSWCVMGLALGLLGTAIVDGGVLTREMVLDYPFPKDDPWKQEFFQV
jgi:hypothetical protein